MWCIVRCRPWRRAALVAFPTETVYGLAASALNEEAVRRLLAAQGPSGGETADAGHQERRRGPRLRARSVSAGAAAGAAVLAGTDHAGGRRFAPREPGAATAARGATGRLARSRRSACACRVIRWSWTCCGCWPARCASAAPTARECRKPPTAQAVIDTFGNELDLVVDDGPCRFGQPSSVVRVNHGRYEMLRAGVVPERTLRRLSSLMLLFVCTGNTCRSPMAELLCRDMLAKRLNCKIDELEDRGVLVMSAGIAAMMGGAASSEAVQVMGELGLDLSGHETQLLTEPLVRHADVIYTMTPSAPRGHRRPVAFGRRADLVAVAPRPDICDPIGGSAGTLSPLRGGDSRRVENAASNELEL